MIEDIQINDAYDRISKLLKNDQQYSYDILGGLIVEYMTSLSEINQYYEKYPPLLDVVELGAALAYEGTRYHEEIMKQIKYKMQELKALIPDVT
jgi:hypothetical protein